MLNPLFLYGTTHFIQNMWRSLITLADLCKASCIKLLVRIRDSHFLLLLRTALLLQQFYQPRLFCFQVYNRHCMQRSPQCVINYSGQQDGIFIYSHKTAVGDEIGYTYFNLIENSQSSISCFQNLMNRKYKGHDSKIDFLSPSTIALLLFSWMVNFQFDFRMKCSACPDKPTVIVGDGTKTGILKRNARYTPLETPLQWGKAVHLSTKESQSCIKYFE